MISDRHRKELGQFGEEVAASFLERHGFVIVGRNIRRGKDELDIVAQRGRTTVIAEVKTTADGSDPFRAIDDAKVENILRAMRALELRGGRIDAIGVEVSREQLQIRWLESIA